VDASTWPPGQELYAVPRIPTDTLDQICIQLGAASEWCQLGKQVATTGIPLEQGLAARADESVVRLMGSKTPTCCRIRELKIDQDYMDELMHCSGNKR
jgi:hypothetical protein